MAIVVHEYELIEVQNIEEIVQNFDYTDSNNEQVGQTFLDLHLNDVNNIATIETESGDSDLEVDAEDIQATMRVSLHSEPETTIILEKVFCITQSYVLIQKVNDERHGLCYYCYYLHQYYLHYKSTHNHINTHIKRKLQSSQEDVHCYVCCRSLYQITLPDVCLICNTTNQLLEIDANNIPRIPV